MNRSGSILLVEDSIDDFEATVRAFKKADLVNPVARVTSAEEGLAYLQAEAKPSLILLDLNMPGMGGRKFLEKVKRHPAFKEIPVVILTTSNYEPDIKACYALGANAYILKQANFDVLAISIKRLKEYWLDTVVLPAVFDEDMMNATFASNDTGGTQTRFAISNGAERQDGVEGMQAMSHAVHLSPSEVRKKIIVTASTHKEIKLVPHEVETLSWIAKGKSRWETGVILGVSEDTIKARLEKCRQKLDAANTTHAIAIALAQGLLDY